MVCSVFLVSSALLLLLEDESPAGKDCTATSIAPNARSHSQSDNICEQEKKKLDSIEVKCVFVFFSFYGVNRVYIYIKVTFIFRDQSDYTPMLSTCADSF